MKRPLLLVLAAFLLSGGLRDLPAEEEDRSPYFRLVEQDSVERYSQFERLFRRFIQEIEANLKLRRDVKKLFADLDEKLQRHDLFTAKDQQALHEVFSRYRINITNLEEFRTTLLGYSDRQVDFTFPADRPSAGTEKTGLPGLLGGSEVAINPNDDLGRLMILEIKMWLAAQLILYDNYVIGLLPYEKNTELRRQINLDANDPEAANFLRDMTDKFRAEDSYSRTIRVGDLVQDILEYEAENPTSDLARDKDNSYFNTLIQGSYAYGRIPNLTALDRVAVNLAAARNALQDDVFNLSYSATQEISARFGNTIGLYEERKGKLFSMPAEERRRIVDRLRPLDILLEKTPFRLTDRFIPGHWGHVAIWVGDSSDIPELRRLGVWQELPRIESEARARLGYDGPPFQDLIEEGHGVLEALRPGVQLNGFDHFLNIDDLAVLRDDTLDDARRRDHLLRAFAQVGKAYDFNFDVATDKRIVCSELAYVVFHDHHWPVEKTVGRYTISPDNVARLALTEDDPLSPVILYHDGKKLPAPRNRENFSHLLKGDYDLVVF